MDFLKRHRLCSALIVLVVLIGISVLLFGPPQNFPVGERVSIAHGTSVSDIASELALAHVIRHASVLTLLLRISGSSVRVHEGVYLFDTRENVFVVAYRLVTGSYHIPPIYVTFPEGVTVSDMAVKINTALPLISTKDFITAGEPQEGYLFPDTYLFPPDATINSILDMMRSNFNTKIGTITADLTASGHSLSDTITMASIVEKEARTDTDKRIVAGILWNRLKRGMRLQVDADPETYTHGGLPATPICNPGLATILAVLQPTDTKYVYYLSDKNGIIHYATTYQEQQANQAKYLH